MGFASVLFCPFPFVLCWCVPVLLFYSMHECVCSSVCVFGLGLCAWTVCLCVRRFLHRWARWRWTGRSRPCVSQCLVRWSRRRWMPWTCRCPAASACGATATCVQSRKAARRKRRRAASQWATEGPTHPRALPQLSEPYRAAQVGGNMHLTNTHEREHT